jgi:hypothetical protein
VAQLDSLGIMRTSLAIGLLMIATTGCDQKMNDSVHYDLEMKEEPSAWVHIPLRDAQESEVFFRISESSQSITAFQSHAFGPSAISLRRSSSPHRCIRAAMSSSRRSQLSRRRIATGRVG